MGGDVSVESTPGKGTTFTIKLTVLEESPPDQISQANTIRSLKSSQFHLNFLNEGTDIKSHKINSRKKLEGSVFDLGNKNSSQSITNSLSKDSSLRSNMSKELKGLVRLKNMKVLIANDDQMSIMVLQQLLVNN